jgi:hypothetical protein
MVIAQKLMQESFHQLSEAKNVSEPGKRLKRLSAVIDKMNEAGNLRKAVIELQLVDIRAVIKSFAKKLAPEIQKSDFEITDTELI